jgi:hypothetical protein
MLGHGPRPAIELINLPSVGLGSIPTSLDSSCACSSTMAGFTNQRKGLTLTERMLGFIKISGRTKKRGIRKK